MAEDWPAEDEAVRYLLGGMSDGDRSEFEVRVLGSAEAQEKVELVEMELIDGYVLGRLDPGERERFEEHYLSSAAGRERVELSRLVLASLAERRPSSAPAVARPAPWRPREGWLAAACLVLALTAGYFGWDSQSSRLSLERTGTTASVPAPSPPEPASAAPRAALGVARDVGQVSFAPGGGTSRGDGELKTLVIPDGVAVVRLDLRLRTGAPRTCRATLQDVDGTERWKADPLPVVAAEGATAAFLLVPAHVLDVGDYVVTVRGRTARGSWEDLASYVFRVRR